MADSRGVDVFTTYCESHTSQVPFHVIARLMRSATGVEGVDPATARALIEAGAFTTPIPRTSRSTRICSVSPIPRLPPLRIDPDARRRRLTTLVNSATLATTTPAVYVIEDAHWIDESSESMLADFLAVIPQTPLLTLITYRPEYRGALAQVPVALSLALAPLPDPDDGAAGGRTPGARSVHSPAGPNNGRKDCRHTFFAEEMVRDFAERGVLRGNPALRVSAEAAEPLCRPRCRRRSLPASTGWTRWRNERSTRRRLSVRSSERCAVADGRRTGSCRSRGRAVHRSGHVRRTPRYVFLPPSDPRGCL